MRDVVAAIKEYRRGTRRAMEEWKERERRKKERQGVAQEQVPAASDGEERNASGGGRSGKERVGGCSGRVGDGDGGDEGEYEYHYHWGGSLEVLVP
jgi:hypothetical protein